NTSRFGKPNFGIRICSRSLSTLVQTHRLFDLPTFEVFAVYILLINEELIDNSINLEHWLVVFVTIVSDIFLKLSGIVE
ncbi:MAG TPA: hypothetical protein LFW14_06065, partial [Rickettsia endosymbiont of Degeeriella rufa]|nr:hypothetical protein [Rickettsia endosymbiont of Degeeriella rufa]